MSAQRPIVIEAEVDPREHPAMIAAAQQLAESLHAAGAADWPIRITLHDPNGLRAVAPDGVGLLSLMAEAEREAPFAETAQHWRRRAEGLAAEGGAVLMLTVFRAVPGWRTDAGARARLERIRRLDRMALDLSHDLGVTVVDIDRAFAHIGARIAGVDYRLEGRIAAEVAGHTIALGLLSLGLDDILPPEVQERARAFHGPLSSIDALVRRRLAA